MIIKYKEEKIDCLVLEGLLEGVINCKIESHKYFKVKKS